MPSKRRVWKGILEEYIAECHLRLAKDTTDKYRGSLMDLFERLENAGRQTNPGKVGRQDVAWVLNQLEGGPARKQWRKTVLNTYLMWCGNPAVKQLGISYSVNYRPNADWLEPPETEIVRASTATPEERLAIHLGLDLGLRRIEDVRLKVGDIDTRRGMIHITGKGRCGGKLRDNPIHELTPPILDEYMAWRADQVLRVMAVNPKAADPGSMFIRTRRRRILPATEDSMDRLFIRISERSGVRFRSHTLRRTWGRQLHKAGVPIETIAELMGHSDIRTTLKYLGINLDDKREAMLVLVQYQKAIMCPKTGKIDM